MSYGDPQNSVVLLILNVIDSLKIVDRLLTKVMRAKKGHHRFGPTLHI